MVQRLMVPVDGSPTSWTAFDVAVQLARRAECSVHVVAVEFSPSELEPSRDRLNRELSTRDTIDVDVEIEVRLTADGVASEIEALVELHPDATLIMASHGRGRSAAVYGSVAEDVLHRTFGPIMLVGPHVIVGDFAGPIVVAVDGSEESEAALPLAASWAIELGIEPWILHSTGPITESPVGEDIFDSAYPARLARDLRILSGHEVQFDELHEGDPAVGVPAYAGRLGRKAFS